MIVSYHPCFEGDLNRLCAGREPDAQDQAVMAAAAAVILPQGCRANLYAMARRWCRRVFPDYSSRFQEPGKIGQAALFQRLDLPHPRTHTFRGVAAFRQCCPPGSLPPGLTFPIVFKLDWGGEGDQIYLLPDAATLEHHLERVRAWEAAGPIGFLLQQFIPAQGRCLRVVVLTRRLSSYWRVNPQGDWCAGLAHAALIDRRFRPDLQAAAMNLTRRLCHHTGINLAGIDLLFDMRRAHPTPLLLEINYFFGRRGLGGSEAYYRLLTTAIEEWLLAEGLRGKKRGEG